MSYNKYIPITRERYDALMARYEEFQKTVDSKTKDPVSVFSPLAPKLVEEILLIREVSVELQRKKDEDMRKMQGVETKQVENEEKKVNGSADIPVAV